MISFIHSFSISISIPFSLFFLLFLTSCLNPLDQNKTGKSTVSATYSAFLPPPENFQFTNYSYLISTDQVLLEWSASERAENYIVRYGTSSGQYNESFSCPQSPCRISNLTQGRTYYFTVDAVNSKGLTRIKNEVSVLISDLTLNANSLTTLGKNGSVDLSWSASSGRGTITYSILRSTTSGSGYTQIASNLSSTSYTDTTVVNGTTYYYVFYATNEFLSTGYSLEKSALPVFPPLAPTGVSAEGRQNSNLLSWSVASGLGTITYHIDRSTTSGAGFSSLASNLSTTTYTDTSALAGITYYYKIRAENAGGISPDSSEASATAMASFTLSQLIANAGESLQVSWNSSTGATSYDVKYGVSSGLYTTTLNNQTSPATLSSLTAGIPYYVMVTAKNSTGSVDASSEMNAIPMAAFTMQSLTSSLSAMNIWWNTSTGASSYFIKYGTSTNTYTSTTSDQNSPGIVSGLTAGVPYYFRVSARNSYGTIDSTNELSGQVYQNFTLDIPFDPLTSTSYDFSNASRTDLSGGVVRLTPADQTDDDGTAAGFAGGTLTGVQYDSTNNYLRLNSQTNYSSFDSSWAPEWDSLKGYWKLDEAADATSAVDSRGNNSAGGLAGAVVFTSTGGQVNGSVYFSGGPYISIPYSAAMSSTTYAISAWLNVPSVLTATGNPVFLARRSGPNWWTTSYQLNIAKTTGQIVAVHVRPDNSTIDSLTGTIDLRNKGWIHVVVMADGTKQSIYVNGVLDVEKAAGVNNAFNGSHILQIGRDHLASSSSLYNGSIDEIAIWNKALTSTQIKTIYDRQSYKYTGQIQSRVMDAYSTSSWSHLDVLTPLPYGKELSPTAESNSASEGYVGDSASLSQNLLGLWRFNESTGSMVSDSSGVGNDGTINLTNYTWGEYSPFNNALKLSTASITLPTTLGLPLTSHTQFSLQFWVRGTEQGVMHIYGEKGTNASFTLGGSSNQKLRLLIIDDSSATTISQQSTSNVLDGRWHHVVYTDDNGSGKLYIDGVQDASNFTYTRPTLTITNVNIGANNSTGYFKGWLDEFAMWDRVLTASEVIKLYRRGANRIKYQIRTCTQNNCSDQEALTTKGWLGPDGTNATYFSELYNTTNNTLTAAVSTESLSLNFSQFSASGLSVPNSRYIQYRAILESQDQNSLCNYGSGATNCSPEISSVVFQPPHFDINRPSVTNVASIGSLFQLLNENGFIETLGSNGCNGVRYTLSSNGTQFYYYDGSAWVLSSDTYATASSASVIATNLSSLPAVMGVGTLQVKTFLNSDGVTACEVSNIRIQGLKF